MIIEARQLGRRFKSEWIFRNLNYQFEQGKSYAIIGPNGSGKSTLLKILSGLMPSSEGELIYQNKSRLSEDEIYSQVILSAPYLELVEELNLEEFLKFHFNFKPLLEGRSINDLIEFCFLEKSRNKMIKNFSSGMKQRLKLGLCFFSDVPVVLLDEPTTNLDKKGIEWYHQNYEDYLNQRLVIICSNLTQEYENCNFTLNIQKFK